MADITKLNEIFVQTDNASTKSKNKSKAINADKPTTRSGCLGGFMFFLFVLCVAVIIAVFGWMCASDVLALNKKNFEATVTLPENIFTYEEKESFDDDGKSTGMKTISHANTDEVSKLLKEAGFINYEWLFKLYCDISKADTKFDPGEYTLKSSYDYRALVQNLREKTAGLGTVDVTIPEGYTMYQIFKKFDEQGVASYDSLLEAAAESNFKYSFLSEESRGEASRLEGYLFPDTYQFYVGMEASSAINKLLQTFYYKITPDMQKQAENLGYSFYNVLKVASIIEREAQFDEDRALVASVIYNRLRGDWQLGMDSTILYMYPEHEGEPTAEMIEKDTPYNTRLHRGLPPTPICNPGLASINAALNPENTTYYYFMSEEDGHLVFFSTDTEFNNYKMQREQNG